MLIAGSWQSNMSYLTCDDYDGKNTPERAIDLKSYFIGITEPTTYGNFSLAKPPSTAFNGFSYMKFDMDISSVSILGGASVNTKNLGSWTAGLSSPLSIVATEDIKNLTADVVYRVYTVVVLLRST